jgi:hypothetical protein
MPRRAPKRIRPSLSTSLRLPETPSSWLNTDWLNTIKRICIREVCKKEFDVTHPNQRACPECQDLHHEERRHEYYVNVELPNIDRVNELHANARAKRCPPKTKDCVVAALYDKISRNDILTGQKVFSGKLGTVIVMVAALYDKIGGDDVLADAHAGCRKTFLAKRSAVTCSPECSDAWHVIYRLGYDETNHNEICKGRREKLAANSKEINAARRGKRAKTCPDCGAKFSRQGGKGKLPFFNLCLDCRKKPHHIEAYKKDAKAQRKAINRRHLKKQKAKQTAKR